MSLDDLQDTIDQEESNLQINKKELSKTRTTQRIVNERILLEKRSGVDIGPGNAHVQQRLNISSTIVPQIRNNINIAKLGINNTLNSFYQIRTPAEAIELCSDRIPFLMFPVRLETKFKITGSQPQLWIRIFPDDISIDSHEEDISQNEFSSLQLYHQRITDAEALATADATLDATYVENQKQLAWKELTDTFGSQRSSWILHIKLDEPHVVGVDIDGYHTDLDEELDISQRIIVYIKPDSWSQAPKSFVMPDKFVIRLYRRDGTIHEETGLPIPYPLIVGPEPFPIEENDPFFEETFAEDSTTDQFFNDDSLWIKNFDSAVSKGMGLKINIPQQDYDEGFTKVVAVGIKISRSPETSAKILKELIYSHHFTNGFSFLPQGTPTNNSNESEAEFTEQEDDYDHSQVIELINQLPDDDDSDTFSTIPDAKRLAFVFDIPWNIFNNIENSNMHENADAFHINNILWKTTIGYYLENMMHNLHSTLPDEFDLAKKYALFNSLHNHFNKYVRSRGPFSAIRVGSMPYGILPVTSFSEWEPSLIDSKELEPLDPSETSDEFDADQFLNVTLPALIFKKNNPSDVTLYSKWQDMSNDVSSVPRVGGHDDPDLELLQILGMEGSSDTINVRHITNADYVWNVTNFVANPSISQNSQLDSIVGSVIGAANTGMLSSISTIEQLWNVIQTNREESINNFHQIFNTDKIPNVFGTIPVDRRYTLDRPMIYDESEEFNGGHIEYIQWFVGKTFSEIRDGKPDLITNTLLYELIRNSLLITGYSDHESFIVSEDSALATSLSHLHTLGTTKGPESLKLLLNEHLDLGTNRLDAWMTSLVTKRLHNIRLETLESDQNSGIYFGAYGWIEDLKRKEQDKTGYIHAPSIAHATTSAILRSAYTNRDDPNNLDSLSVNLSSQRTRLALWLVDGVRQGQKLSTLLGYQFERGLHENHPELELDVYITAFRELYPTNVDENKISESENDSESMESITARNVVDGMKLITEWKRYKESPTSGIPFGETIRVFEDEIQLPPIHADDERFFAIANELDAIDDALDAVSDLGLSESVFQLVQKNFETAGAFPEGLAGGGHLPDAEIVKTPRTGIGLGHSVAILFTGDSDAQLPNRFASPKSRAERNFNNWVSQVIGDPANIKARINYQKTTYTIGIRKPIATGSTENSESTEYIDLNSVDNRSVIHVELGNDVNFIFENMQQHIVNITLNIEQFDSDGDHVVTLDLITPDQTPTLSSGLNSIQTINLEIHPDGTAVVTNPSTLIPNISEIFNLGIFMNDTTGVDAQQTFAPIDLLYMSESSLSGESTEIEQRIAYYFREQYNLKNQQLIKIEFTRDSSWDISDKSIKETFQLLQKMLDLFANADYLNPTDLKGTIEIDSDENIETQNAEEFDEPFDGMLWQRFITAYEELFTSLYGDNPALKGLSFLVTNLNEMLKNPDTLDFSELKSNVDSLRQELLLASRFGLSMAIPQSVIEYDVPTVQEDILNRGISTINEIESRIQKIRKIVIDNFSEIVTFDEIPPIITPIGTPDEIDTFVSSYDKIIQINNCLKILFGKSFTVMPQFTLSSVIQNEVITSMNTFNISKQNKITWFQQASQTHKQLKKFEDFSMLKTAMNNIDDLDFSVCQLPHPDNNQWIGIQTDELGEEQQAVRSLVFYSPTNIDLQQSVSGIILDQWNESIPNKKETTGIAYNYNCPSNEAPNAILLVVPPVIEQTHATWKWSYLVNAIDETLDLAKIRAVDLHAYKDLGAFLPALYIPTNLFNTKGILPYYRLILDYNTSGGIIN